jgi:hypothetical protein
MIFICIEIISVFMSVPAYVQQFVVIRNTDFVRGDIASPKHSFF